MDEAQAFVLASLDQMRDILPESKIILPTQTSVCRQSVFQAKCYHLSLNTSLTFIPLLIIVVAMTGICVGTYSAKRLDMISVNRILR